MAGQEVGALFYDLNIDDKNLKKQLDDADKSVKGFGDRINAYWGDSVNASKKVLAGVTALAGGVVAFGVSSVKAFTDSQKSLTQLDAVLKSTGGAAGVTRDAAIKLSKEIQRTTSVSDEAALSIENMGLTFTNIGHDIFPDATKAALDMATAMNGGLKPSAEQAADNMKLLGKALQDPDQGLGALHRVGVNTDELAKKFEGLTDVTQKQKLILKEIATEFGGSAEAQAKTFQGRIDQLKNAFNDLQEGIGEMIAKALGPLADSFSGWIDKVNEAGGLMEYLRGIFQRNKDKIIVLAGAIAGALVPAIISMTAAFGDFLLTISPWMALGVAVVLLFKHLGISFDDVREFAGRLRDKLSDMGLTVDGLRGVWQGFLRTFNDVKDAVKNAYEVVAYLFGPSLVALWDTLTTKLWPALLNLWDSLKKVKESLDPGFTEALKYLATFVGGVLYVALWSFINLINGIATGISKTIESISSVLGWLAKLNDAWKTMFNGGIAALSGLIDWFRRLPGIIAGVVGDLSGTLWYAGWNLIGGFFSGVVAKFQDVKNFVASIAKWISDHKGPISYDRTLLIDHGNAIMAGLNKGLIQGFQDTVSLVGGMADSLGANIISPNMNVSPSANANMAGGNTTRYGDTILNIGNINNSQDESLVLRRLDRNSQLESMGMSPTGA